MDINKILGTKNKNTSNQFTNFSLSGTFGKNPISDVINKVTQKPIKNLLGQNQKQMTFGLPKINLAKIKAPKLGMVFDKNPLHHKSSNLGMQIKWKKMNTQARNTMRKMFPDSDGDRIPNIFDCQPRNIMRQDTIKKYEDCPKGVCHYAVQDLGRELEAKGISREYMKVHQVTVPTKEGPSQHMVLEAEGTIYDPTGKQYDLEDHESISEELHPKYEKVSEAPIEVYLDEPAEREDAPEVSSYEGDPLKDIREAALQTDIEEDIEKTFTN